MVFAVLVVNPIVHIPDGYNLIDTILLSGKSKYDMSFKEVEI